MSQHEIVPAHDRPYDRRAFLRGSLAVVGGVALARIPIALGASHTTAVNGFLELSEVATGVQKLPGALAREYLEALDAAPQLKIKPSRFLALAGYTAGHGAKDVRELKDLPAFKAEGGKECVEAIVAAWWSGMVPVVGGQRVVTYSDALVWREVHEPMTCQGATGSWAKPGRAVL